MSRATAGRGPGAGAERWGPRLVDSGGETEGEGNVVVVRVAVVVVIGVFGGCGYRRCIEVLEGRTLGLGQGVMIQDSCTRICSSLGCYYLLGMYWQQSAL